MRSRTLRLLLIATGSVVGVALLLLALAHTPVARVVVRDRVVAALADAGVDATVEDLRYNLLTLDVELRGVRLAATDHPAEPFLTAARLRVDLPWSALSGLEWIELVEIDGARVALRRDASGATNLPTRGEGDSTAPPRLPRIDRLAAAVDFSWVDRRADVAVELAELGLRLDPANGVSRGPLELSGGGTIRWAERRLDVDELGGELAYDGRTIGLAELRILTPPGRMDVEAARLSLGEPLDVEATVGGRLLVDRGLALLAGDLDASGELSFEARVSGLVGAPTVDASISGRDLRWQSIADIELQAEVTATPQELTLSGFEIGALGARWRGDAGLTFDPPGFPGRLDARWTGLDAERIADLLASPPPLFPAANVDGELRASWSAVRLDAIELTATATSRPGPLADARLPLDGRVRLEVGAGRWQAELDQRVPEGVTAVGVLSGQLAADDPASSTLGGELEVTTEDVGELWRRLERMGVLPGSEAAGSERLAGAARARASLAGTLGEPRARGTVSASRLRFGDIAGGELEASVAVDMRGLEVESAELRLARNRLATAGRLAWSSGAVQLDLEAEVPELSELAATLAATVRPSGSLRLRGRLRGTLETPEVELDFEADRPAFGLTAAEGLSGSMRLAGPYETLVGGMDIDVRGLIAGGVRFGPATVDAVLGDGEVEMSAAVPELNTALEGRLQMSPLGAFSVGADVDRLDLTNLFERLTAPGRASPRRPAGRALQLRPPASQLQSAGPGSQVRPAEATSPQRPDPAGQERPAGPAVVGYASLGMRLEGDVREPSATRATIALRELDGDFGGTAVVLEQAGLIEYDASGLRSDPLSLRVGRAQLRLAGSLGLDRTGEIALSLEGDLSDFADLVDAGRGLVASSEGGALERAVLAGPLLLELSLSGSLDAPAAAGRLRIEDARIGVEGLPQLESVQISATLAEGIVELQRAVGRWQGVDLSADGMIPLRVVEDSLPAVLVAAAAGAGPARLELRAGTIGPSVLEPFVDPAIVAQLTGQIVPILRLEADAPGLAALRGELILQQGDLTLAGARFAQQVPTRLTLAGGTLSVAEWRWSGPTGDVTVSGDIDIFETAPTLAVRVDGSVDLRLLRVLVPAVATGGRADVEVRIHGSVGQPLADGSIRLEEAELRVTEPRLAFTEVNGTLSLTTAGVTVEEVSGLVNGGTFELTGEIAQTGGVPTRGSLTFVGRQLVLEVADGLQTLVDADLTLVVAPEPMTLRGAVTVLRGAYREPLLLTSELLAAFGEEAAATGTTGALEDLRLDVRVLTEEDVIVDNNLARVAIGADLTLTGTVAQPGLAGRAELREGGEVFFSGNRFRIETGTIDFIDPTRIRPEVDMSAQTRVSAYDVSLALTGTPDTLQVDLSSSPDLPQSDLVSLLVTGRTLESASSVPVQVAREQVVGLLTGELSTRAGRAIGIDSIRLERTAGAQDLLFSPTLVATETDPTSRVSFYKQLRPDLDMVFSQSLAASGGFTWIVSYRFLRSFQARVVSDDDNDRSYELAQDLAFGGARGVDPAASVEVVERVRSIVIEGGAGLESGELRGRLRLEEGDRFDFFRWQAGRDRLERFLYERGYLEARVRTTRRVVESNEEGSWLEVRYQIERGPATQLEIEGHGLSGDTREGMREAWRRSVFDDFLLEELRRSARVELAADGYVLPSVEARVVDDTPERKRIVVDIVPGARVGERRLDFRGNSLIADERLQTTLREAGLLHRAWVAPEAVARALGDLYRSQGLLDATIIVGDPEVQGSVARLPIRIDERAQYRVAGVEIVGTRARPPATIRGEIGIAAGDPYSADAARGARRELESAYRAEGFASARVRLQETMDTDRAEVTLTFAVEEGPRQVLREIVVEGAERTVRPVIDRALQLEVGEPLDPAALLRARRGLYDTGIFRRVDIEVEPLGSSDLPAGPDEQRGELGAESELGIADEQPVRARVRLQERPRFRFRYGLRIRDEAAPLGEEGRDMKLGVSADFSDQNVLGRAITAGVATRLQSDFRALRGFVNLPTFFGLPVITSAFVRRSREEVGQDEFLPFITDRSGLTLEQSFRPRDEVRVAYSYAFERNRTFEKGFDPDDPFAFDLTVDIAKLRLTAVVDTRDDIFDSSTGWFHSSSIEYSTPALGSDLNFAKYLLQQTYFRPLLGGEVILASAARLGLASAFDEELVPNERFFAGGGNSVRGYEEDSLAPTDVFGRPIGGEALLVLKQEVRFPLLWRLRGVGFLDAGNAFATIADIALGDLATSAGLGLRIDTPFVLLRLDYGFRLGRDPGEPIGGFFFSIGQAF